MGSVGAGRAGDRGLQDLRGLLTHEAAAPPSSDMNARRFTRSPRRPARAVFPAQAECLGGLEVDHEFEFRGLNYR
jgi:hypothetical protein